LHHGRAGLASKRIEPAGKLGTLAEHNRLAKVAEWYDSRKDFDYHLIKYGASLILEHAAGDSLLELGCAGGVMTEEFVKRFPKLVVVDGSEKYVETAREIAGGRGSFHVSLFEDFEPGQTFDNIVMASILEHIVDPVGLLQIAKKWLNRGGMIHVIVPNAGALNRHIGKAMGMLSRLDELHERDHQLGHRRVYNRAALQADIEAAGLKAAGWDGIFLKPLSNAQMAGWLPELVDAFYQVGKQLPDYCSQIYARCAPG
jgi:2-polyprenyl-3-methyl-5-hydroxy-6-metoxy-1,4-benzoquinol methylase